MKNDLIVNSKSHLNAQQVGNKAFNLAKLNLLDLSIPPFFCMTVSAFELFLKENKINLSEAQISDIDVIQQHITNSEFPLKLWKKFEEEWNQFRNRYNPRSLTIRSSAIGEDSKNQSFAGQFKTILNISPNIDDVKDAIRRVWASQFDPVQYFKNIGGTWQRPLMGVVVQQLIEADISGVLFTQNPVSSDMDEMVLEINVGLGEKLVSGEVVPDQYIINKNDLSIKSKRIEASVKVDGGLLKEIISSGLDVEKAFSAPQDIEWAISSGKLFILQSRSITSKIRKENYEVVVWTDENVGEVIPDIITPLSWSMLGQITNKSFLYFINKIGIYRIPYTKLFNVYKGKVYLNQTGFRNILDRFYFSEVTKKVKGNLIQTSLALFQIFWTGINAFILILQTGSNNKKFLLDHKRRLEDLKTVSDLEKDVRVEILDQILLLHQSTMNYHVTVTFLGEIFYQGLKSIFNKWKLNTDMISTDVVLQGLETVESSASGLALWELCQSFAQNRHLCELILNSEVDSLPQKFEKLFPEVYEEFSMYLETYGHGALHEFELLYPRWYEKPDYLYKTMRSYLQNEKTFKSESMRKDHLKKDRESAIADIYKKLNIIQRLIFSFVHHHAQIFIEQRESLKQAFLRAHLLLRINLIQLGKQLVIRKKITSVEDVFYLNIQQLKDVYRNSTSKTSMISIVDEKRKEREKNLKAHHPKSFRQIGDRIELIEDNNDGSPISTFQGIGCSNGKKTGHVCVLSDPEQSSDFSKGDILITMSTNPGWTPLFIMAGGIVTEIGGALSHGAIIAREYGIPMVTAVPGITKKLNTGDLISLDGSSGIIKKIYNMKND